MHRVLFLILLLLVPFFAGASEINEETIDDIEITFEFSSPNEEIVAHFEAHLSFSMVFDFTNSQFQDVSSLLINNFTISYIAFEAEERILFDHTTFLDHKARNTSNSHIYEYGQSLLEELDSNPFTRSSIDILVFVDFTVINLDINSTFQISPMFSGPVLVNPLSIAEFMRNIIIIGSLIIISVLLILRKRRISKNK